MPQRDEDLFDAYLDAALAGEVESPADFCERHGIDSSLADRLSHLYGLIHGEPPVASEDRLPAEAGLPWERLGDFRLLRVLGEGGMGIVYLAEQESLGRLAAVKVVRPELVSSPTAVARFDREARAIAKIKHGGIVEIYGTGETDGVRWLAMEFAPGQSLRDLVRASGPLAPARVVRWGIDLARALQAVHEQGILHRDVKPSNVRITPDDRALLIDFGLARDLSSEHTTLTAGFAGSPHYCSPEQLSGKRDELDARADVYSLGATIYEALAGITPFSGETADALIRAIMFADPQPLRRRNARVSKELETVVHESLERRPEHRYPTAAAFADDLEAVLDLRPIRARPPTAVERAGRWVRRHRTVALSAVSIAVTLAVVLVFSLTSAARKRADDAARASENIERAARILAEHERRRTKLTETKWTLRKLRSAATRRQLTQIEKRRVDRLDRFAAAETTARVEMFAEVEGLLNEAGNLDDDATALSATWAACYYQRWRDAQASRDRPNETYYARLVRMTEPDGPWIKKVDGLRQVKISSEPSGAEVSLYRYAEQAVLQDGGERRLVPYLEGEQLPLLPGTWALRVVRGAGALAPEDLITTVEGHPIEGCVLVSEVRSGVEAPAPFDRLVAIDDEKVEDLGSVEEISARPGPHRFSFRGPADGPVRRVTGKSLAQLGITVATPADVAMRGGVRATVLEGGVPRSMTLPRGLVVRTTGAPLVLAPVARIGTTPIDKLELAPAWYVAVMRAPGYENQRVAFHVDHPLEPYGHDPTLHAKLLPEGTTPEGFVYVGCDVYHWPERRFWMLEREITSGEYLAFLNHPETRGRIANEPGLIPKGPYGRWPSDDGGVRLPVELRPDVPVLGVSFVAARAYVAWRNEHDRARPPRTEFDLPTSFEWTRSGKGGDSRQFVFGAEFRNGWTKSRFSHDRGSPEPVMRYPIDESPFGIFDLAGSAAEWCFREDDPIPRRSVVCSGSLGHSEAADFEVMRWRPFPPDTSEAHVGFRLVLRVIGEKHQGRK